MKYFTFTLNDKEINLRLRTQDICRIEKLTNKSVLDVLSDFSMESLVVLLRFMRRSTEPNFSEDDAYKFVDELVDNGFVLETIYTDIVLPACAESGLLKQSDLEMALTKAKEAREKQATQN